jgi:hypothetical protein
MRAVIGVFYEFHKERIVSAPGAPLATREGMEIGPPISWEAAMRRVASGKDVYTLNKQDAYRLASHVAHGRPIQEFPHTPPIPSPSGREDVYYRHYHPGGLHPNEPGGPGHVFFGGRGEGFGSR